MSDQDHNKQYTFAEQGRVIPPPSQNVDDPMRVFDNEKVEAYDQTDFSFESMTEDTTPTKSSAHRGLSARHIQMISLGGCIGYNGQCLDVNMFLTISVVQGYF